MSVVQRVLSRTVAGSGGCVVYTGGRTTGGYGTVWMDGRNRLVHRVMYEAFIGPIPEGLVIDHLCGTRACVNHLHLEAVTQRVNQERAGSANIVNEAKTHCPQGHEYTDANTRVDRFGKRYCRTCQRERANRLYKEKKAGVTNG